MADASELELISSMPLQTADEPTFSVSELNELVQSVLHQQFPRQLWVRGEIQDYDRRKDRKTVSFTLAEKSVDSDDVLASVTAIMFPQDRQVIETVLRRAENAFQLQDGIEVRFRVEVDLWVKAGRYQLHVCGVDPTYTLGRMAQNRQRIIEILTKRGLLDRNKQLTIPLVPLHVGLIASKGSAGFTDFVTHLEQSGSAFKIQFLHAAMQGSQVEPEVSSAIRHFNRTGSVDVIVIVRGGGGDTDLSWFDRLGLAETIATSQLPVLTGLGHTHNVSVADVVAHANLKTPTDVAQFLVDRVKAFLEFLSDTLNQLGQGASDLIHTRQTLVKDGGHAVIETAQNVVLSSTEWLAGRRRDVVARSKAVVSERQQFLRSSLQRFRLERTQQFLEREQKLIWKDQRRLVQKLNQLIQQRTGEVIQRTRSCTFPRLTQTLLRERQWLSTAGPTIRRYTQNTIATADLRIKGISDRAAMLDPIKTLKRGFSITRNARGGIVTRVTHVRAREDVEIQVSDGMIHSQVNSTELANDLEGTDE